MMRTLYSQSWMKRYGPWALITGASDGIGEAIAKELASAGMHLVLVARRKTKLEALASELEKTHAVDVMCLDMDLGEPSAVSTLVEQTADLDIGLVVASAGFGSFGTFVDLPLEDELNMVDVNCRSVVELSHHFGQRLTARGAGGLVLFSSLFGFQGVPYSATYAATKGFIQSFSEGLNVELKAKGVDVLCTAPGPVYTGFADRADVKMAMGAKPEEVAQSTLKALGQKRTVKPGKLASAMGLSMTGLSRNARTSIMSKVTKSMV